MTVELPEAGLRDTDWHWPVKGRPRRARGSFVVLRTDQVRMPDGDVAPRDVVEHPGAVAIVALNDDGRVLLIRQYRHPVGQFLWEIPAGLRDVPGELPHRTGVRELREETGYTARTWHVLTDCYTSPGISTERVIVYLARGLAEIPDAERGPPLRHEEAHLEPAWVPLEQAVQLFLAGELHNGVTAVGILAAYAARQGGFAMLRKPGQAKADGRGFRQQPDRRA